MLAILLVIYAVVVLVAAAFVFPRVRNRLPTLAARRFALIASLAVIGYTVLSPACFYLPIVPGAPATRRVLLGEDQGQLYWLEGTITRFAFAAGPRWWSYSGHTVGSGFEFLPPLRLARMKEREVRWELVRSDGRRTPFSHDGWYAFAPHVVAGGGVVFGGALTRIRWLDPRTGAWNHRDRLEHPGGAGVVAMAGTRTGVVAAFERSQSLNERSKTKHREFFVRWFDLAGVVVGERRYLFEDWSHAGIGDGFHLAFADGKLFAAQVGVQDQLRPLGKVYLLPAVGDAVEVCSFTYNYYLPLSFAVNADGRYFSTGQSVWRMDGSHVMPLVPALRMVMWQGSSVIGIRSFPFVGDALLARPHNIMTMLAWVRQTDPEVVSRRYGNPDLRFAGLWENLSIAVRRREPWYGGLDDSGGADEIVRVEIVDVRTIQAGQTLASAQGHRFRAARAGPEDML